MSATQLSNEYDISTHRKGTFSQFHQQQQQFKVISRGKNTRRTYRQALAGVAQLVGGAGVVYRWYVVMHGMPGAVGQQRGAYPHLTAHARHDAAPAAGAATLVARVVAPLEPVRQAAGQL